MSVNVLPFSIKEVKYYKEIEAAVDVVERACKFCVDCYGLQLISNSNIFVDITNLLQLLDPIDGTRGFVQGEGALYVLYSKAIVNKVHHQQLYNKSSISVIPPIQKTIHIPYSVFQLLRLPQIVKVIFFIRKHEENLVFSFLWIRSFIFVLLMLFWVHTSGCIFYLIADVSRYPELTWIGELFGAHFKAMSVRKRYGTSLYWSMTTFTTVGYGDLHPFTEVESLYASVVMFVNLGLSCYALGELGNIFVATCLSKSIAKVYNELYLETVKKAYLFHGISSEMLFMLAKVYNELYLETVKKAYFFHGISSEMLFMLAKVYNELYLETVKKAYLFHGISSEMLFMLYAMPDGFYIIIEGTVDFLLVGVQIENVCGEISSICDEISSICDVPHMFRHRARGGCKMLFLSTKIYNKIISYHQLDGVRIISHMSSVHPFSIKEVKYYKELEAAIDVVERACKFCVDVMTTTKVESH
ncbi:hypothetical protein ACFE04_001987 [Oxalis oulophora]